MSRALIALVFILFLLGGCETPGKPAASNPNFTADKGLPKKMLLLPASVNVSEVSAGGVVEKVQEWSDQAKANLDAAMKDAATKGARFELVPLPDLSGGERELVDQHLSLYRLVALEAWGHSRSQDPAWAHKKTNFDYTVGPGLQFLKDKTGADAVMVLVCEDYISSGGRKAMMVFATILAAAAGVVAVPQGAPSFVSSGVVTLDDGNIQWFNYSLEQGSADLRKAEDAKRMVNTMLSPYPGLKK